MKSRIHFIDMKAFAKRFNEMAETEKNLDKFTKWMMLITEKDIDDKDIIRKSMSTV